MLISLKIFRYGNKGMEWRGQRVCFILKSQDSVKNLKYFDFFLVQKTRLVSGAGDDYILVSSEYLKDVSPSLYLEGNVTGKVSFAFKLLTRVKKRKNTFSAIKKFPLKK